MARRVEAFETADYERLAEGAWPCEQVPGLLEQEMATDSAEVAVGAAPQK